MSDRHSHGRPQTWARGGTCLPLEYIQGQLCVNYNILVRTKRNKIVPQDMFHRLKIYVIATAVGVLPRTPLGEHYSAPTDILEGFKGSTWQGRRERERREGRRMERQGKGWRGKGGRRLFPLLKEFKRAPMDRAQPMTKNYGTFVPLPSSRHWSPAVLAITAGI